MVFEAAYFAEVVRAGIQSISKGQVNAAKALGMTYSQTMRLVILPQAFRKMLPLILQQSIILFKIPRWCLPSAWWISSAPLMCAAI